MHNLQSSKSNKLSEKELQYYTKHALRWEKSNLTQKEYCHNSDINYGTFVYMRNKIAKNKKIRSSITNNSFVPVKVLDHGVNNDTLSVSNKDQKFVRIYIASNIKIEIPLPLDAREFTVILKALEIIK